MLGELSSHQKACLFKFSIFIFSVFIESNNVSMKSSHQNHNALIFNSNALSEISLRPNSPTFDRMLQVFENLKTTHHSHNNENLCVDTTLELNDDVRTLHLLSLYFPKFELTSDFDLNPPNYLEQARFDAKFDVFFTLGLSNMTTTVRIFTGVYSTNLSQNITVCINNICLGPLLPCCLSFGEGQNLSFTCKT